MRINKHGPIKLHFHFNFKKDPTPFKGGAKAIRTAAFSRINGVTIKVIGFS